MQAHKLGVARVLLITGCFSFPRSGRTEKQAVRDAQIKVRTPPSFLRVSSRRYQRRAGDAATDPTPADKPIEHHQPGEVKYVSVPQPAHL